MPGPILIKDVEPVSQYNPPTEPRGQEVYISRPTVAELEGVLASSTVGAGATLNGGDISATFPLAITAANDDLELRLSAAPTAFTTVLIPIAVYANLASLVAAVNSVVSGIGVLARTNVAGNGIALESLTRGVNSYLENDSIAGGSVANGPLLLADGVVRTIPPATDYIAALNPVLGALDVSTATINAIGVGTATTALALIPAARGTTAAVADAVAPQFQETPIAIESFQVGVLADFLNAAFTPDSRRIPPLALGPAITVVEDDGVTPFVAPVPSITTATFNSPGAGDVTIAGFSLGSAGAPNSETNETTVKVDGTGTPRGGPRVLRQELIIEAGGVVSATSIVIPAAMIPGSALATTNVQVKYRSQATAVSALV
jgi:hypothetical protein